MQGINVRNLVLRQLLFELNDQLDKQRLQINLSLRKAVESILDQKSQLKIQITNDQVLRIKQELTLFLYAFTKAPSTWVQLLKNDQISAKTTKIVINKPQTLTKVYNQLIKQTNNLILESKSKIKGLMTPDHQAQENSQKLQKFDFEKTYIDSAALNMVAHLLNNLAHQICVFFQEGKKIIQNEEKSIEQKLQKSQIMNPYYLFGMLKQMSSYTYRKIQQSMTLYFHNLTADTIRNFCRYVQKNFQFVELVCQEQIPKIYNHQELNQQIQLSNEFWLNFLASFTDDQLSLKKVTSSKGQDAIMLIKKKDKQQQNQQKFGDAQKLILKIGENNKIQVTNAKASQKKWEVINIKDSVSSLYKIVKDEVVGNKGAGIKKQVVAYGVPLGQYSNVGGSLGKCLADINKYKDANSFFKDLSKSTIVGGSISYALAQIPILSYFVLAGGLTYTFYHTFRNQATSTHKKFKQLGKASLTAVGSVGSAVAGMMIGQTLIPVPFVGAFVGGVIGGFLGQTGGNLMTKLMAKQSYKNLLNYLRQTIQYDVYWKYTPQLLQKLGIHKKYFFQKYCKKQGKQDAYITAVCFCVVSSYESKRYTERNEKKIKQLQKKGQSEKEQKDEDLMLHQQQVYETQFDIVGIVDYLTSQKLVLLLQHDQLQNCIRHLSI